MGLLYGIAETTIPHICLPPEVVQPHACPDVCYNGQLTELQRWSSSGYLDFGLSVFRGQGGTNGSSMMELPLVKCV